MATTQDMITELYVGYFNRAPDPAGLSYWEDRYNAGMSLGQIANSFSVQSETTSTYPYLQYAHDHPGATNPNSVSDFITQIYQNLFNRAPDAAGLAYYTGQIAGGRPVGWVIIDIINGAQGDDKSIVANKVTAGEYYAAQVTAKGANWNAATDPGDVTDAHTVLSGITADPGTIAAAKATADSLIAADVAGAFTLTNGTDVATANVFNAPQVYTPGGNDRINSLQDEDQLTGVGTNPTLNATLGNSNDNGATTITPKLTGIETINAAFTGSGGGAVDALDLQDATGLKELNVTRVSQAVDQAEIGNIKSANVGTMSLANTNANQAGVVEFSFAAGVLKGENTGSVKFDNVDLGAFNLGQNTSGIALRGVGTNGYEHLTITSTGAANTIRTINLPMDTGTTGSILLKGDQSITLATDVNITNPANGGNVEAVYHGGGIQQAQGRLQTVDASGMTGDGALTLNIAPGMLSTGKADTSGVNQDVTITGTGKDDTFYLNDLVQAGDKIIGGAGTDTLVAYQGGVLGMVTGVENVDVEMRNANVTLDFDKLPDANLLNVRNISSVTVGGVEQSGDPSTDQGATLTNLTATQAAGLVIQHSTTGNNGLADTTIQATLKNATGTSDTVAVDIKEGINTDPRFNFTLDNQVPVTGVEQVIENVTLKDSDTESNTVQLSNYANHTGTIMISGGLAGTFLNLDYTDAQEVTPLIAGDYRGVYGYDISGGNQDLAVATAGTTQQVYTSVDKYGTGAAANAFATAKIDAAGEVSDVVVRVGSKEGQTITLGSGNDTVVFDASVDRAGDLSTEYAHAGLTNSDSVTGGAGKDTLVVDGESNTAVTLQQSEWQNVKGMDQIYIVSNNGTSAYTNGTGLTMNYRLDITDNLINSTDNGSSITIRNDINRSDKEVSGWAQEGAGTRNANLLLDLTNVNDSSNTVTYDGAEGGVNAAVRVVFDDASINGLQTIDGGDTAVNDAGAGNDNVIEVQNSATVTIADLAGLTNLDQLEFINTQSTQQTLNLDLNNLRLDALIDSNHTASAAEMEAFTVNIYDSASAGSALVMNTTAVTGNFVLNIDAAAGPQAAADADTFRIGANAATQYNLTAGAAGTDKVEVYGSSAGVQITGSGASQVQYQMADGLAGTTPTGVLSTFNNVEIWDFSFYTQSAGSADVGLRFDGSAGGYATATTVIGTSSADVIIGGTGNDNITGGVGNDFLRGGIGADVVNADAGVDTISQALADSVATTATTFAGATVAAGDTLTFAGGVDRVVGFTAGAGGDALDLNVATVTSLIGETVANLTAGAESFFVSGNYNAGTGVFTVTANGVGADTAIVQADNGVAASDNLTTNASIVVLVGVDSDNLVVANFV